MTDWWLNGGILAADCIGAYQAIGAVSYAASLVNLANPGTYDLTAPAGAPSWEATNGWQGNGTVYLSTGINPHHDWSVVVGNIAPYGTDATEAGIIFTSAAGAGFGISVTTYGAGSTRNNWNNLSGYSGFTAQLDGGNTYRIHSLIGGSAYVGDHIVSGSGSPTYAELTGNLCIMKGYENWKGTIQAVAIYNRTLSASEYLDIWAAISGLPGAPIDYLPIHSAGANIYVIP